MKNIWCIIAFLLFVGSAYGQSQPPLTDPKAKSNLWIMWENISAGTNCTAGQDCPNQKSFLSHFILNIPSTEAGQFFQSLEPMTKAKGSANLPHKRSPICLDNTNDVGPATPSTEAVNALALAEKKDTLRGLNGVFVDLRAVIGPAGYKGTFGQVSHTHLSEQFALAGIPILSKDNMLLAPGNPELSIRFSPEIQGCRPWSLSFSLKQTMLLSRDLNVKLRNTSWSTSSGQDQSDIDYDVDDALRDVVKVFIHDYKLVNDPNYVPPVLNK
ncbi:MAG: hypothetical protein P8Q99_11365 [Paracoccaceae bacterium]|nr:hypothetical protein [Paracoccaceae bacterium]